MNVFKVDIRFTSFCVTKVNKAYNVTMSGNKPSDFTTIMSYSPAIIQKDNLMQVECTLRSADEGMGLYYEIVIPNKNIEYLRVYNSHIIVDDNIGRPKSRGNFTER
jgi:hypothetical protein